jgi:ankyrin repeat protein
VKIAQYLLEHGADPKCQDWKGYRLMNLALRSNEKEMIELVLLLISQIHNQKEISELSTGKR